MFEQVKTSNPANERDPMMIFKVTSNLTKIFIPEDPTRLLYYMACPDCKKKVMEEGVHYRCENCNKTVEKANPNYNFSARVGDLTDNFYV